MTVLNDSLLEDIVAEYGFHVDDHARLLNLRYKRITDVVIAIPSLLASLPLMAVASAAIKLEGLFDPQARGPVFFSQERIGYKGVPFTLYKLRTMKCSGAPSSYEAMSATRLDEIIVRKDDARVTRVGKWLRKLSLDELPQLYNVLKGDLTMSGPRPMMREEYERLSSYVNHSGRRDLYLRFYAPQGLTGPSQVNGRKELLSGDWTEYDVAYARSFLTRSVWKDDVKILLKTVVSVLSMRGAS